MWARSARITDTGRVGEPRTEPEPVVIDGLGIFRSHSILVETGTMTFVKPFQTSLRGYSR